MPDFQATLSSQSPLTLASVARGAQPLVLADLARAAKGRAVFVAPDDAAMRAVADAAGYFAPELDVIEFPAWDCLPYDRVSPGSDAAARRLDALAGMAALANKPHRAVVLTTANALLQRVPPAASIEAQTFRAKPGNQMPVIGLEPEELRAVTEYVASLK